jgi:hypothetical protein
MCLYLYVTPYASIFPSVKVKQPAMNLISYLHGDLHYVTEAINYIQQLVDVICYVEHITVLLLQNE